jgi:II/X family phage/plasmid replication protein
MVRLVLLLGLTPDDEDYRSWLRGSYRLTRVDLAGMYDVATRVLALSYLRAFDYSARIRRRGRGEFKGGTLYFGKHSRRWSLKVYSKAVELESGHRGHGLSADLPMIDDLLKWVDNKLRFEVVLRRMELVESGLDVARNWLGAGFPVEVFSRYMATLEVSDQAVIESQVLESLAPRLVAVYNLWKDGHDLRQMFPKVTFYRYRNQLLEYGIDISLVQPREKSNVIPLLRFVEAKPASIPAWAYGTPLYYDPLEERSIKSIDGNGI